MSKKIYITSHSQSIEVEFNDYSGSLGGRVEGSWRKEKIDFQYYGSYVEANVSGEVPWYVGITQSMTPFGKPIFTIDDVNGKSPGSINELHNMLKTMLRD